MLNDEGVQNHHHQSSTSIQIGVTIPVVRIWLKELFITRICWLRWLAWWSIIRKIWFRRLFRINTILIVSNTSIGNAIAIRRLIISIGITSSCSSIWISLWMHHWKSIKSFLLKVLEELSRSLKLWYDLSSTPLKYDLHPIPKFYKCSSIRW